MRVSTKALGTQEKGLLSPRANRTGPTVAHYFLTRPAGVKLFFVFDWGTEKKKLPNKIC